MGDAQRYLTKEGRGGGHRKVVTTGLSRFVGREGEATSARESNAGDDFHFLWASRRVLALLDHRSGVQRVTIEALAAADDPDDDFEAIDIAEYYGGDNLPDADHVVVSQLKYSTRHPETAWTLARMRQTRKAGRSVLRDLAELYHRLAATHGREFVVAKLTIRLVSNQPADPALVEAVATTSSLLAATAGQVTTAALKRRLSPPNADLIRQMSEHLSGKLSSGEFTDFLRSFDLSELGAPSRFGLRQEIGGTLASAAPGLTSDAARSIYQLVQHEAGPEGAGSQGISATDVLAHLEVACQTDLIQRLRASSSWTRRCRHVALWTLPQRSWQHLRDPLSGTERPEWVRPRPCPSFRSACPSVR